MIKFDINSGETREKIGQAQALLEDGRPLFQEIAKALESQTESNFEAQGRPAWVPHAKSTIAARLKRNNGGSVLKILQDHAILAKSISTEYGPDFTLIGAGGAARHYAAIHQLGGVIHQAAYSKKIRLRTTDKKGTLHTRGNLATFAKKEHKRFRESWVEVKAYDVTIPARPYLPFIGNQLQPQAATSILDIVNRMLSEKLQ